MQLIYSLGIYLGVSSVLDLWKRRISLVLSFCFLAAGIVWRVRQAAGTEIIWSLLPGLVLIGISFVTGQKLGMGDGIVILVCGVFLGFQKTVVLVMGSLFLSSFAGMAAIAARRAKIGTKLPWIPFVFAVFLLLNL